MADTPGLGPGGGNPLEVQVLSSAPAIIRHCHKRLTLLTSCLGSCNISRILGAERKGELASVVIVRCVGVCMAEIKCKVGHFFPTVECCGGNLYACSVCKETFFVEAAARPQPTRRFFEREITGVERANIELLLDWQSQSARGKFSIIDLTRKPSSARLTKVG